jgi:antitoxin YqcF
MSTPTPLERELGRSIRSRFGAQTKVIRFADDKEINEVFVVSGNNCPVEGVTSYGSVGLSRNTQRLNAEGVKVEIVAACESKTPNFDSLVASCVFDSVKNGSNIVYGSCIADILVQYQISDTLKHVTFVAPFLWQGLDKISVEGEIIYCLMMLPISDAERQYLNEYGIDALESIFNEKQIDVFDINRPSVLM